ncbi:MAG TPA: lytic transglycosylase domain-containing protein [Thermoanaerobaculia bacterium]|nr:lytic transglycosylase domain-containing protein [Thermoanaerobaculia bacterium]
MTRNLGRTITRRVLVIGALALVFLWLDTSPTTSSVPTSVPQPPDLEHVQMLEEIAAWMAGPAADERQLDALARKNLSQLIRERPRRFELFRAHLDAGAERAFLHSLPYGDEIEETAARHRLDALLLAALVEAESSFLPDAVSPVGAVGLTQVMPATAAWLGGKGDLTDPGSNLDLGARYLSRLIDRFDGDLELALAAYNAGPTNVLRYRGVPPFRETRNYVRKVLSIYAGHNWEVWETAPEPTRLAMR